MIYSVHGYYRKRNSRKQLSKIEAIVFANSRERAEELIEELFEDYPAELEPLSVVGGLEHDLNKIYAERPELWGIDPNCGYIYNKMYHINCIRKYFG